MTSREIREAFLNFFQEKGHQIVPSAPVVVKNDPTLMFTNAGMNQFKDLFLGERAASYSRATDTQRCLRVSGKHNDLEEVGIDTYHHTLFEMLGNWSFGDYFKKEAIGWAWELLTEVYKLDVDRLYVTIFEGDEHDGLSKDMEAYDFWKAFIAEDRILLGNKKDNFWEMGDTGPCGPCSEIHYDMRPDAERAAVSGADLVNQDDPQVIEIWNLVFMQFNRLKSGALESLPAQHVDTGMGFERLVRAIQGKVSNYDTDVFQPLISFTSQRSGIPYGQDEQTDIAMRVLADHVRAVSFTIADGQLPSNNKAGYVIRRILRRAVRYAYTFLGFKEPFLNELVPILAQQFKGVFDVLGDQESFVQKVVLEEELSFLRTLTTGIQRFESYDTSAKQIDGDFAFELFDTFGFPIDLTELLAREKGLTVDMEGFQTALNRQKERSRAATTLDLSDWTVLQDEVQTEFVGYDTLTASSQIVKYRKVTAKGKDQYQLILDITPFYPEGGGQVGDVGTLINTTTQEKIQIVSTKKENALIVHFVDQLPASLEGEFVATVDAEKRADSEANHSATHLLHAALRDVLGTHVQQKGSLVSPEVLRFDITHFSKVTDDEIKQVEDIVNTKIRANIALKEERNTPYQEAIASGVTALFGEKYGDYVRVITFDDHFSKELCGGTHVSATGKIGFFKIVSESAVAAGVRRIEAVTGSRSAALIREQFEVVNNMKELLHNPKDFVGALAKMIEENGALKKEVQQAINDRSLALKTELLNKVEAVGDAQYLAARVDIPNADAVKGLAYALRDAVPNLFLVLATVMDDKPFLLVMIADDLAKAKGWNAGAIIRELAKEVQGGGGGQPFFATAGGKDVNGIDRALERAREFVV
ncbi:alanine--tRNA ligase [Sphingobacterium corticibacter]|uniref:Alanine--tRNA ligase n=1 Tax=Sphingobacterium corticibacter TaxID=2171749 RepID=A0A2T8HMC2_9SPHI|nr:alanine--tRNA ligase [Sphingobacterium corticibacter]PVH26550.1 alanine--tRNA ligase [Sphingobacterium corticibacter]